MATKSSETKTLEDLLEHGLKDMYYAENKIVKSLEKMVKAAEDEDLKAALEEHRGETEGQIATLEKAFEALGKKAQGEKCDAMDGILKEGDQLLADFKGSPAGDAAIIFSAQAVEHYEIARYGSLRNYAELLGEDEVAEMMQQILDQEGAADEKLTDLADGGINDAAAEGMEEDDEEDDGA
ncbi:DUF892 family protein [Paracoccus sp. S-4012]|uniref:YciE/YciF ferroxidase family protein n=1 Tax=Paracoccus sp. S-4012 TaxID=2665648 RepID=UPI0012B15B71|nr:ferritin-like domain-containing protein [Paracoccus sp. S-4012]MRX50272.1 DUF892 family protein [Paracoccus sp. S-4012]